MGSACGRLQPDRHRRRVAPCQGDQVVAGGQRAARRVRLVEGPEVGAEVPAHDDGGRVLRGVQHRRHRRAPAAGRQPDHGPGGPFGLHPEGVRDPRRHVLREPGLDLGVAGPAVHALGVDPTGELDLRGDDQRRAQVVGCHLLGHHPAEVHQGDPQRRVAGVAVEGLDNRVAARVVRRGIRYVGGSWTTTVPTRPLAGPRTL